MVINYELLKTFVAAASARTFGEAAAARRVSVSAISQQVKALEVQLGVPLFERLGRRVRLTDTGRELLGTLEEQFARIDHALEGVTAAHTEVRGEVRIGSPRAFGRHWLRPRLPPLLAKHPGLRIQIQFDVPSVLERRLVEGALDLALLVRPAELAGVETAPLAIETFVAAASPKYLERWGTPRTLADFQKHRYAVFDADLAMHEPWWRASFGRSAALPSDIVCRIASLEEMAALAEAGVAIAVLPDYAIQRALDRGRLRKLQPKKQHRARPAQNTIFLAWRSGAVDSARLRTVRAELMP